MTKTESNKRTLKVPRKMFNAYCNLARNIINRQKKIYSNEMEGQNLEIIKSIQLFLKVNERSPEVILLDQDGEGNMYFTFEIQYIPATQTKSTRVVASDKFHAIITIQTHPNAIAMPIKPIELGGYGADNKPLYIGFRVQPRNEATLEHEVNITFYVGKEI